ncbi:metallophosphoesterase [Gemmatimonadota bacterium]
MPECLFASDLHGRRDRYEKLFRAIEVERPDAVFLGGDLLPSVSSVYSPTSNGHEHFVRDYLKQRLKDLRAYLKRAYPRIFLVLGNDDGRLGEADFLSESAEGLWEYVHNRKVTLEEYSVFGYSYVPPTPFLLKDWEKYDVSRFVDPGCVSPEEGIRSVPVCSLEVGHSTIKDDLAHLVGEDRMEKTILLFHSPPYETKLDRAALDGRLVDHVPMDVHVGSIAIRRFIVDRQPLLTLHGHVHESATLTGCWKDRLERTHMFTAAHEGPELALVRFDPGRLGEATRELV